jgi:hypothetical protein
MFKLSCDLNTASKFTLWICLQYFCCSSLMAQSDDMPIPRQKKYDYEQVFSTNHWNFFVRPGVALTNPYYFSRPGVNFRIYPAPNLMFGWMYQFNFKKRWGIQTGVSIEWGWIRFSYLITSAYSGTPLDGTTPFNIGTYGFLSVPLYAVYRLPLYDRHHSWLAEFKLGVDLKYGGLYYDSYGTIGSSNIEFNANRTFNPTLHVSAGIEYILPNKKLLQFSIIGSIAPIYTGQYSYSLAIGTPKEIDGSFSRTYSYLGFELNYIFTRVRHMKKARPGYTVEPIKDL